ncbi:hypothetical protein ACTNDG_05140 [Clostridium sp. HCP1S3_B4]|uniref:hypothetical protein n=1 Tax=unclassified Clostridium TaxID=2614128 RepID=UPI003F8C12B5
MKFKKGFTLAECIAYIFIFQMIIIATASITMKLYYTYDYVTDKSILNNAMDNAFFIVRKNVNDNDVTKIKYHKDKITLYLCSKDKSFFIKEIKMKDSYLYIYYYESYDGESIGRFLSANQILYNIKEVKFIKNNNIIYMKIVTNNNEEYVECV